MVAFCIASLLELAIRNILSKPNEDQTMIKPILVLLGDYSNDQAGYNQAHIDGAVYKIDIDESPYSALYNVQKTIEATCTCLGAVLPAIGVAQDNRYIPLSVIEDTALTPNPDYQDLDEAFVLGLKHEKMNNDCINKLRSNVFDSLDKLQAQLKDGSTELDHVDHCIGVLKNIKEKLNRTK